MSAVKTSGEILKIKKACQLGDKIYSQILKKIRVGVTEKEIKLEIIRLIWKSGARISFRPIVAFGKNAYKFHHVANNTKLRKNHGFVKIDLGTKVQNYCSDMTRTVFFGKANKKQKKIYQTVLKAQKKSIDYLTSSFRHLSSDSEPVKASRIDQVARDYIRSQGFPLIPHSVGHGIGKRVHEGFRINSKSKTIMKNGMVFTIEPGIYIKGYGGVRIEDTFYLKKGKLIQLTKSPKNLIEL